jgi:hypothetical protein
VLRTQIEFTLPCGYVDAYGTLHRDGAMRLATALDEVEAMGEARRRSNGAYATVALLGRVITRLGDLGPVDAAVVERLFSADFVYLQELFMRANDRGGTLIETECPDCGARFALDLAREEAGA